jgi:hypothetical protein
MQAMVAAPLEPLPLDLPTSPHTTAGHSDTFKLPVWGVRRLGSCISDESQDSLFARSANNAQAFATSFNLRIGA